MLKVKRIGLPISLKNPINNKIYDKMYKKKVRTKVKTFSILIKANPDFSGLDTERTLFSFFDKSKNEEIPKTK